MGISKGVNRLGLTTESSDEWDRATATTTSVRTALCRGGSSDNNRGGAEPAARVVQSSVFPSQAVKTGYNE